MQKCESCNTKFSYSHLYKAFWLAFSPIKCQNCGTRHEATSGGRARFILLVIIPFLIIFNFVINTVSAFAIFGSGVLIIFIVSFLCPFIVTYKKDEYHTKRRN